MITDAHIADEARRLGFVAVGSAQVGPSQKQGELEAWLARGCHAGMEYLRRHAPLRSDPHSIAPWAKSIVCVAARYPVNTCPDAGFSSYAKGEDYHEAIRRKLMTLADTLRREFGVSNARACVDTAPVSEREWAVRAGLGWIGRQGQLVNPRFGCCLVLGELLVDVELQASAPMPSRCGSCRKCVEACPTEAIDDSGLVDCRLCLSYLTIEHHGDIPEDIRERMGGTIFGCDRCTVVCPWNRFGEEAVLHELQARAMPEAEECLQMTETEFQARFARTAIERTGLERLKRTAAVALGNTGDPSAGKALRKALASESPLVASHAGWALERLGRRSPGS